MGERSSISYMKEELLKGLSDEQIAKIKACKNQNEVLTLAKEEGIELTEEQLEAVNGGCGTKTYTGLICPKCGGRGMVRSYSGLDSICTCRACGYQTTDFRKCDPYRRY